MVRGDLDAALACVAAVRAAAGPAGGRRELLMADRLEGVAWAWQGDERGVDLIRAAMVEAERLGATWLMSRSRAFLGPTKPDLATGEEALPD